MTITMIDDDEDFMDNTLSLSELAQELGESLPGDDDYDRVVSDDSDEEVIVIDDVPQSGIKSEDSTQNTQGPIAEEQDSS